MKSLPRFFTISIIVGTVLSVVSCGGGGLPATLTSIVVTPATPSIATGATKQFTATGTYSDGSTKDLTGTATWSSSDGTRATVSAAGLATAASNAAGPSTITATSGGVSGSAVLKVIINLPKTGQSTSYDTGMTDDGALQMGVDWPSPRFTNPDGTAPVTGSVVVDQLTGLMWLRDANCINTSYQWMDLDGTLGDGRVRWDNALGFAAEMGGPGIPDCGGGYTDWRVPNRKELRSLINYGQPDNATWLNSQGFTNVQADDYLSSTTHPGDTTDAWTVNMGGGSLHSIRKDIYGYVWPVRDTAVHAAPAEPPMTGQATIYGSGALDDGAFQSGIAWPITRFTTNADTTVTDNLTGLVWAPNGNLMPIRDSGWDADGTVNDGRVTWQHALDYVAKLNSESYLGRTNWRLPNVNELESLVHAEYTKETTCSGACTTNAAWLNTQGFSNVQADNYWSSTTFAGNLTVAWNVVMLEGSMFAAYKTSDILVWPVRSGE